MLWPAVLPIVALINSLAAGSGNEPLGSSDDKGADNDAVGSTAGAAGPDKQPHRLYQTSPHRRRHSRRRATKGPLSRAATFWVAAAAMFAYQFFPGYLAPMLSAVSVLCLASPQGSPARLWGSAVNGVGMLSLSFDWSVVGAANPIVTPLWATVNQFVGMWIALWLVIPLVFTTNAFGIDSRLGASPAQGPNGTGLFPLGHALNSVSLFDRNGTAISATALLASDGMSLNGPAYDAVKPVYISSYLAVEYALMFALTAASVVHVALWYGADVWERFKSSIEDLDATDVHCQLMAAYREVPESWYLIVFFVSTLAIIASSTASVGFDLPWYAALTAVALAAALLLPFGTLAAISGQLATVNILAEVVAGFMMPGRILAVMAFKAVAYMAAYKGIVFLQDLKLAHYLKVPPRAVFAVQLYATALATLASLFTVLYLFDHLNDRIMHGLDGWS
ncbi:hypothetical protein HK405_012930, partial [Cladochytrium tenue]